MANLPVSPSVSRGSVKKHRYGVRTKFISLILLLMFVVFGLITAVLVRRNTSTLQSDLVTRSQAFAALATTPIGDTFLVYKDSGHVQIQSQIQKFTDLYPDIKNVAIVDTSGKVLFSQAAAYDSASVPAAAASSFNPTYSYDTQGNLSRIVYPYLENFGLRRYSLVYWVSSDSIAAATKQIIVSLSLLGMAGLILAAFLIFIFVNRLLLRPIKSVSQTALRISGGALDEKITLSERDEIGDLALSINTMADSLKQDIQKLKALDSMKSEFMAITSHNLRTPLTIMRGSIEILQMAEPGQDIKPFVASLAAGADRLGDFANDMITISQLEAGQYEQSMQTVPIAEITQSLANDLAPLAKAKHINFSYDSQVDGLHVVCSPTYLRTAVWSVLDNAIKFTADGGSIGFSVTAATNQVVLSIKDSGAGISPDELANLFTKFHRATSVLQYDYEGTGLGLYLTKLVIDQHHGTVEVASQLRVGTTVTIKLPTAAPTSSTVVQ